MTAECGVLAVSVVICACGEVPWEQLRAAIGSVLSQQPRPAEVLLVVDRHEKLAKRARQELTGVRILENRGVPGLSGARDTGLRAASQPITAFLDDDAEARPGWLKSLVQPYGSPDVVATGGSVHRRWPRRLPRWLPPEFSWVVGGSYHGLPVSVAPVRHPIGANMSMLTGRAVQAGGFDAGRTEARSRAGSG
ncbi:MAG: glycosyltransferase, partial [Actinomycetota bacterium]|nr:glycosyltransferase [Actinomycetota bacterium]